MKTRFLLILFVTTIATVSNAADWTVTPDGTGDAPTIQAAVDSASSGDTVLLTAGIFSGPGNRDVDFRGKAITVTSISGAAATTVDCEGVAPGFRFQSGEGAGSVLSGLTITNGNGTSGGGIQISGGSPVIRDNVITNCFAGLGGGLYCTSAGSPSIGGNTISYNTAALGGGIIIFSDATPTISGNTISYNTASSSGGGIYDGSGSTCSISGNHLLANESTAKGGAVSVALNATPQIDSNVIEGNKAWGGDGTVGAGIYCDAGTNASITNNTFTNNWYPSTTGGLGGGAASASTKLRQRSKGMYSGETGATRSSRAVTEAEFSSFIRLRASGETTFSRTRRDGDPV